jgi:hypothetical protein
MKWHIKSPVNLAQLIEHCYIKGEISNHTQKKMACKENDEFFGQNFLFLKK